MSLDAFFGPRESSAPGEVRKTAWPHAPERLRAVLDAFEECEQAHPRSEAVRQSWVAGARAFTDELGEDGGLVKRAYRKMRNANLDISSPRSLITVARRLSRESIPPEGTDDEVEIEALQPCPRCGAMILSENIGQECRWHKGLPHQQYEPRA